MLVCWELWFIRWILSRMMCVFFEIVGNIYATKSSPKNRISKLYIAIKWFFKDPYFFLKKKHMIQIFELIRGIFMNILGKRNNFNSITPNVSGSEWTGWYFDTHMGPLFVDVGRWVLSACHKLWRRMEPATLANSKVEMCSFWTRGMRLSSPKTDGWNPKNCQFEDVYNTLFLSGPFSEPSVFGGVFWVTELFGCLDVFVLWIQTLKISGCDWLTKEYEIDCLWMILKFRL